MNATLSRFSGVTLLVPLALGLGTVRTTPHNTRRTESALPSRTQFRQDMRKLWSDHVIWTRDYIIAAAADAPDLEVATNRLMKNQEDIGKAVGRYYGNPAGDHLTALLKQHIQIAADLINAAKAGDNAKVDEESHAWDDNADSIATMLSHANPRWPKATLMGLLKGHLSTTTDEVKARLAKNWDDDASAFDAVYDHILKLADALADGILKQFPTKFTA
jgi:hypothetical protein